MTDSRSNFTIEANGFGVMVQNGGRLDWSNFEVRNTRSIRFHNGAGPSHLADGLIIGSGTPTLGDYPIHFHLLGDSPRGTLIERVEVRDSANRAFVVHGSNGVTLIDTKAVNIIDTPYWWDAPGSNETCTFQKFCTLDNSNDIVIEGAFVDGVTFRNDRFRLAGFQLGAGSGNAVRNSHGQNIHGTVDCAAFHWPESANQNIGGNVWVFESNTGTSDCHGVFVWQNDSNPHVVSDFTGGGIDHGAYSNVYHYERVTVPYVEVHATGWTMTDSAVGVVILRPHQIAGTVTWTNVAITSIRVEDAPAGSADEPVTFTMTGTNATCTNVVWTNPHPMTQVILNGVEC